MLISKLLSDMLSEVSSSVENYQATRNKRPRALSQTERQPVHLQSNNPSLLPSVTSLPSLPQGVNAPFNTAAISDWDLLLMQMGNAQPNLGPAVTGELGNPGFIPSYSVQQTGHNNAADLSHFTRPDEQVPEYPIIDDLFSLWSDIPVAFRCASSSLPL